MTTLPINRSPLVIDPQVHSDDHNELHRLHNILDGSTKTSDAAETAAKAASVPLTQKGQANGVATLDGTAVLTAAQRWQITNSDVSAGAGIVESKLSLASDAAAGTASRRTLGTGATQACAGNDSRLSDTRTPSASSIVDSMVAAGAAIAESKLNLASDAVAGTASRRTLGTGAQQAAAGNDARFTTVSQNFQTGTSYTLVIGDAARLIEMNNASANTLTVPPNSSVAFPVGTVISWRQYGVGVITFTQGSGVSIKANGNRFKSGGQYAEGTLTKRATDEWVLSGDITT